MHDAEYIFRQESREKKRIGRGAYSRKAGSKSKSCRLPSDNLTDAQKRKLNGKVITINMTEKISWERFKKMPEDLQKSYILSLRETHKGRMCDIAEMFGMRNGTVSAYICNKFPELKITGSSPRQADPEWIKFMNGEPAVGETLAIIEEENKKQNEEPEIINTPTPTKESKNAKLNLEQGCLIFEGEPSLVFGRAMMVFGKNKSYRFIINFKEESANVENENGI
jgi:hypothetical protein